MPTSDRPFSSTYIIEHLYRNASKRNAGIWWAQCGRKLVVGRDGFRKLATRIAGKSKHFRDLIHEYIRRNGFVQETSKDGSNTVWSHPCFVRGRRDLLRHFTLRNSFCWVQGIGFTEQGEVDSPLGALELNLLDLGRKVSDLHRDCLELGEGLRDVFHMVKARMADGPGPQEDFTVPPAYDSPE